MKRRQTQQKKEILEVIEGKGRHLSAEDVKANLDAKGLEIGLATVYRNLNLLVEEGKIQKFVYHDRTIFDGNDQPHDHFHCVCCDEVSDIERSYDKNLDKKVEKELGKKILFHSATFEGICENCLKKEENKQWN